MNGGYCYRDVLPFAAMATVECTGVGLITLFKAATFNGMSYQPCLCCLFLCCCCFCPSSRTFYLPKVSLSPLVLQSSTKLEFISDNGVCRHQFQLSYTCFSPQQPGASFHPHTCHHFQAQIMEYPSELTVVFFYNLCVSIIALVVGLITEEDSNSWRLEPKIALVSVVCSGLFGSFLNNAVRTWALRVKGPHYVAMFKPLSIAIAVAMGLMFLGDTLHFGSLVGATIISIGFYTVIRGKAKEDLGEDSGVRSLESPSTPQMEPLLQSYKNVSGRGQMQAIM